MICTLKSYEWKALANLLEQGYPAQNALTMIREDLSLTSYLEQGMELSDLLLQGHQGNFYTHLTFFISITSLHNAIHSALAMEEFQKGIQQKFLKQTSYPLILFLFSFLTLYMFSSFVIPQLMQSFDLSKENSALTIGVSIMETFVLVTVGMLILALIGYFLAKHSTYWKVKLLTYLRFTKLPQKLCSYTLAGYFRELSSHGITTRHACVFLQQLSDHSLISICARQITDRLENGTELSAAFQANQWIDTQFLQSWNIAVHTQNMCQALDQYMLRQEEEWSYLLKRIGLGIQMSAYLFVALMVVLVYQIMLVPLQMLETI